MNNSTKKNYDLYFIHLSVFLFGFSALFARFIGQSALVITFGRVLFSSIFLAILILVSKQNLRVEIKKDALLFIVTGINLAVHWFSFIESIRVSNVAVGTVTFSTFPVFIAFFEPLMFKEKLQVKAVICALIMLFGVAVVAMNFGKYSDSTYTTGIVLGLASSLTYAVMTLLNRRFSARYSSYVIVFYEQSTAAIALLPFIIAMKPSVTLNDAGLLLLYGIVFTAIAHGLFVKGLRTVKASIASIISGLEPVYAILLAFVFLHEPSKLQEIIGGVMIITVATYMSLI
ncbi:MAG: EamA family transporter [Oscillospiraceae bacterium]|nr:EamA family transporter [Oscillospiraceae bacterium]